MKLDGEQMLCHGTAMGHKLNSKSFEYDHNDVDSFGLKSGNGAAKENHNGRLKDREGDADSLQYAMDCKDGLSQIATKFDRSMNVNENGVQNLGTKLASANSPFEDPVFYMDKSVMERELPELIVCYEENTYHVVKDICIDEGVPSKDKFWFDTSLNEKTGRALLHPEKDVTNVTMKEKVDLDMPVPDMQQLSANKENLDLHLPVSELMKFSEEKQSNNDLSLDCVSENLLQTGEADHNPTTKIPNNASKEIISLGDLLSMPDIEELSHSRPLKNITDEVEQKPLKSLGETDIMPTASTCQEFAKSNEGVILGSGTLVSGKELNNGLEEMILETNAPKLTPENYNSGCKQPVLASTASISEAEASGNGSKEAESANDSLDCTSEEFINGMVDEVSYDRNVKSGSITSDFNSGAPATSGKHECPEKGYSEHQEGPNSSHSDDPDSRISSRLEDLSTESVSSRLQSNHMESSFSSAVPISGLITYSGPIAYSGSLSLRSDSSTTSTRSFAFPVLQSEWNSSPVRMAKADRRHFRKHKGWRQGLFCCKF